MNHVTIHRWVQHFTPLLVDVDETYVKVAGRWRYVYRAVDQDGQVIDVFVSPRRNIKAARTFFTAALAGRPAGRNRALTHSTGLAGRKESDS